MPYSDSQQIPGSPRDACIATVDTDKEMVMECEKSQTRNAGVLKGECLIYFGPEPWEGLWRNRHQLMSRFAKTNTVFYVEPRTSFKQLWRGISKGKIGFREIFGRMFSVTKEGVYIYHSPKWLPANEKPLFRQTANFFWKWLLLKKTRKLGAARPIVWLSRPDMVKLVGEFNEKLLVYHVVDEYLGYYGQTAERKEEIKKREQLLLKKADVVIVVSNNLKEKKSKFNENTFLVPNAVDYDSYAKPSNIVSKLPDIKGNIIGYSGLISNRLDVEMLNFLAEKHKEWSFVLVGEVVRDYCEDQMARFEKNDNVHFIGRVDVDELPSVIQSFEVGIIPYKVDLQANNVSPLKIYEYMAAGLPVVTTDFSVAREFDRMVYVCGNADEFESALMDCIKRGMDVQSHIMEGKVLAKNNTWDHRVLQISCIIRNAIRD